STTTRSTRCCGPTRTTRSRACATTPTAAFWGASSPNEGGALRPGRSRKQPLAVLPGDRFGDVARQLAQPRLDVVVIIAHDFPARRHPRVRADHEAVGILQDRKSTRLNSSH